jgi:uncharacterized cysteine cluster protein YcgN (CxxCxxCC family)
MFHVTFTNIRCYILDFYMCYMMKYSARYENQKQLSSDAKFLKNS